MTPIIWMPELLPNRAVATHEPQPVLPRPRSGRAPMLGEVPSAVSRLAMIGKVKAYGPIDEVLRDY